MVEIRECILFDKILFTEELQQGHDTQSGIVKVVMLIISIYPMLRCQTASFIVCGLLELVFWFSISCYLLIAHPTFHGHLAICSVWDHIVVRRRLTDKTRKVTDMKLNPGICGCWHRYSASTDFYNKIQILYLVVWYFIIWPKSQPDFSVYIVICYAQNQIPMKKTRHHRSTA